ncbi:non-heme iron oxygenase ferredoxin subunit [Streptomyces phaeochromogenes]|uniref:Non-heme iron oxygenase ferredoxin subunit n=1 Tax=Streptomyces phaeochromogenes TaxID=1923 RepID=A0ABZ1HTU1_STRPH|nr:non-heme iron oxygenase ferredoxin subunit [Streptomyces phaeochromogenes]WRZ35387.1 non-heme iron oxygenase ferredoxin subunit [Streptomyces phaeochromogenes]WSD20603.1 non-heme iron oxygenase ferredoxin subunit [Streptomyces phaeochromogenes]WSJ02704.1 non-heme iron oxygenase ferredoxin subunit [Streptomyces phaeochromogenes]WSS98885.1 non-heme iron oxygenase ferredoxin subunit [Streptomyces phaeochromogenes]WTA09404.1 non-heme iron oxygenase ferredoxin subunit [Streptomyces phaeochromoge
MPGSGYTYVCKLDVLKEGVPRRFEVESVPVSLVLTEEQVFAIHDVCSHSAVSLSEGEVDGCTVECWLHASRFDLRTGHPLDPPATRPVPVYPVRIEDGSVYVCVRATPRTEP